MAVFAREISGFGGELEGIHDLPLGVGCSRKRINRAWPRGKSEMQAVADEDRNYRDRAKYNLADAKLLRR
jgi:hypothetical protein